MRRLGTVAVVLLAMAAAVGVGAFIAAHSTARDRPGVGGATGPSASQSRSPIPEGELWNGAMISRTSRSYRSGGTCTTEWRLPLRFEVASDGSISGSGTAKLRSGPECPFVTGQPQLNAFDVQIAGSRGPHDMELRVSAQSTGTGTDYGGFGAVFSDAREISLPVEESPQGGSTAAHPVFRVRGADTTLVSIARNTVRVRSKD